MKIEIDRERLLNAFTNPSYERGSGKTTARIHELLGHVQLQTENIFVVITSYNDLQWLLPMIKDIFEYYDVGKIAVSCNTMICENSRIKFITTNNKSFAHHTRGMKGFGVVYMRHGD